jgi:serine/threonine protein kinase
MLDYTGRNFGNYRLVEVLGKGGFAHVYRGEHIHLRTQAAIKVLTIELTNEMLARFRKEVSALRALKHPHIVLILDFGIKNFGTRGYIPYIVMNYAPKGSLRELYPLGTRLPPQKVVTYVD